LVRTVTDGDVGSIDSGGVFVAMPVVVSMPRPRVAPSGHWSLREGSGVGESAGTAAQRSSPPQRSPPSSANAARQAPSSRSATHRRGK
jgi:hypothetical protein